MRETPLCAAQAIYVPADDLTDPAPATTFAHLDATTVLSRSIAELGIYPAVDPLDSTSRMLSARVLGQEHYDTARAVQRVLQARRVAPRVPSAMLSNTAAEPVWWGQERRDPDVMQRVLWVRRPHPAHREAVAEVASSDLFGVTGQRSQWDCQAPMCYARSSAQLVQPRGCCR